MIIIAQRIYHKRCEPFVLKFASSSILAVHSQPFISQSSSSSVSLFRQGLVLHMGRKAFLPHTRRRPKKRYQTTPPSGWVGPGVGFQKSKVYLKGTCNARARVWRPRASGVPRRARSREEVPWSTAVSSSSRAAPGVRRLTRGCTVAAPAAHRRLPVEPRRRAVPRARCGNSAIAQRRATRQLEGNQRQRSSLIGREVGGWAPVAGTKNRGCCLVLFFRLPPAWEALGSESGRRDSARAAPPGSGAARSRMWLGTVRGQATAKTPRAKRSGRRRKRNGLVGAFSRDGWRVLDVFRTSLAWFLRRKCGEGCYEEHVSRNQARCTVGPPYGLGSSILIDWRRSFRASVRRRDAPGRPERFRCPLTTDHRGSAGPRVR